jgi:hypothetical protein
MLEVMKTKPKREAAEIELHPDAWERFEKAVDVVMKSPPKHRTAKDRESLPKSRRKRGATKPD